MRSITGPVNASFQYDAVGRRTQKTIGSATSRFLYDGSNYVQEQNASGAWTATELTAGIDEVFARMTSTGIVRPIADAQGSVIAETNSAQAVTTGFGYEPYGKTTQTGASSGNSQQYTGRENDGTGLYYYRARYYSPTTGRFVSEDPIGFSGGPNAYAYVRGNPVQLVDSLGLKGSDPGSGRQAGQGSGGLQPYHESPPPTQGEPPTENKPPQIPNVPWQVDWLYGVGLGAPELWENFLPEGAKGLSELAAAYAPVKASIDALNIQRAADFAKRTGNSEPLFEKLYEIYFPLFPGDNRIKQSFLDFSHFLDGMNMGLLCP
jgi:RHS repeat-associated protein